MEGSDHSTLLCTSAPAVKGRNEQAHQNCFKILHGHAYEVKNFQNISPNEIVGQFHSADLCFVTSSRVLNWMDASLMPMAHKIQTRQVLFICSVLKTKG